MKGIVETNISADIWKQANQSKKHGMTNEIIL
jgi:hypothetical protein